MEMQDEYLKVFKGKAESDKRVKAAWLEGSFAKGKADRYSDIDVHLLIQEKNINSFRQNMESWLSEIRPLVLFRSMFEGKMFNCLTEDGLRVDIWLHQEDSVTLGDKKALVLFDRGGSINYENANDQVKQRADIPATIQRHIEEFWRLLSILPAVLGRNELISAFMGITFELNLLTEVLILGIGTPRDTGVKRLNPFIPAEVKTELEHALDMEGLNLESLARVHLRLVNIMQLRGPGIAEKYKMLYPHDLERAVIRYVSKELRLLGIDIPLGELHM